MRKWSSDPGCTTIGVRKNKIVDPILPLIDADGVNTRLSKQPMSLLIFVWSTNFRDIIHGHRNVSYTCLLNRVYFFDFRFIFLSDHTPYFVVVFSCI